MSTPIMTHEATVQFRCIFDICGDKDADECEFHVDTVKTSDTFRKPYFYEIWTLEITHSAGDVKYVRNVMLTPDVNKDGQNIYVYNPSVQHMLGKTFSKFIGNIFDYTLVKTTDFKTLLNWKPYTLKVSDPTSSDVACKLYNSTNHEESTHFVIVLRCIKKKTKNIPRRDLHDSVTYRRNVSGVRNVEKDNRQNTAVFNEYGICNNTKILLKLTHIEFPVYNSESRSASYHIGRNIDDPEEILKVFPTQTKIEIQVVDRNILNPIDPKHRHDNLHPVIYTGYVTAARKVTRTPLPHFKNFRKEEIEIKYHLVNNAYEYLIEQKHSWDFGVVIKSNIVVEAYFDLIKMA